MSKHHNFALNRLPLAVILVWSFISINPSTAIGAFVYDVDRSIGDNGRVMGTITTNMTLGNLMTTDITAFNLDLTAAALDLVVRSTNLNSSNSTVFSPDSIALIATQQELKFTDPLNLLLFIASNENSEWRINTTTESIAIQFQTIPSILSLSKSSTSIPGDTFATRTVVPIPSAMLLFGSGLAALGAWRHRKGKKS